MKFKYILLALTPCLIALGCKKKEIMIYDSDLAGIYFRESAPGPRLATTLPGTYIYTDSLNFSFADGHHTTKDSILRAPVQIMGNLREYNRPFKIFVDPVSTAIEGKHYEIDYSSAVIPAGDVRAFVRVKFKRTEDMRDSTFRLVLKLENNEHFNVYMERQRNTNVYSGNAPLIAVNRWKFSVHDIITKPDSWKLFGEFWGQPWSVKKYTFINSILGWTHYDWTVGYDAGLPPVQYYNMAPAATRVRDSLQALANAGTPLLDENGKPMIINQTFFPVRY